MSQIKTGTCSVTNGSDTVIGDDDADWSEVNGGDLFKLDNTVGFYMVVDTVSPVSSVSGFWELVLHTVYGQDTQAGATYSITRDFTPNLGLPYPTRGDVETASIISRALIKLDLNLAANQGNILTGKINGDQFLYNDDALQTLFQEDHAIKAIWVYSYGQSGANGFKVGQSDTVDNDIVDGEDLNDQEWTELYLEKQGSETRKLYFSIGNATSLAYVIEFINFVDPDILL